MINLAVHYVVPNNANWVVPCWFYNYFWSLLYALSIPFSTNPISPSCCSYAPRSVLLYRQVFMLGLFVYFFKEVFPSVGTDMPISREILSFFLSGSHHHILHVSPPLSYLFWLACPRLVFLVVVVIIVIVINLIIIFFFFFFKSPSTGSSSLICLFYCYLL